MRDIIDERNERERISKSIIKYWNVNYVPAEPTEVQLEADAAGGLEEKPGEAESFCEAGSEDNYNDATRTYSGYYGRDIINDEVKRGQIDKILHEKTDAIRSLFRERDGD